MGSCEARQYSDQMQCGRCGYAWDINDPDPPQCKPRLTSADKSRIINELRESLK